MRVALALLIAVSSLGLAAKPPKKTDPQAASVARLGRGIARFRDGDYAAAIESLRPLEKARLRNIDYALYFLAESESLTNHAQDALGHFRRLAASQQTAVWRKLTGAASSRFALLAEARAADMAYELGLWKDAQRGYHLMTQRETPEIELAVARFRLAEMAAREKNAQQAAAGFRAVLGSTPSTRWPTVRSPVSRKSIRRPRSRLANAWPGRAA